MKHKNQLILVLVVIMLVNLACGGTGDLSNYPKPTPSATTVDAKAPPATLEPAWDNEVTFEDVVAMQTAFPPVIDWDKEWKEYRIAMGEDISVGRPPSEAEATALIRGLEQDGIYLTASEEEFREAGVLMADGGAMFLMLALSPATPWPDELIILGHVMKQGIKYLLVVGASVMAARTIGDLEIQDLKDRTSHTDWRHDVRSLDAQTYINTLRGTPPTDPNLMCAVVKMTGGAIRYVMAQKISPHLNRAIFGWYTRATWGGAYVIDTKDFPSTSSLIEAIEWVACSQLPPAPPLPQ